jgi:hypothetical protein
VHVSVKHPDWGEFPNTILQFETAPPLTIDLRDPITVELRDALARVGLERSFGIITAQDPRGETQPPPVNAALAANLRVELERVGIPYVPVCAGSRDHRHREDSFAAVAPRDTLVALARRYEQLAIFWFDGERFSIVPALAALPPLELP